MQISSSAHQEEINTIIKIMWFLNNPFILNNLFQTHILLSHLSHQFFNFASKSLFLLMFINYNIIFSLFSLWVTVVFNHWLVFVMWFTFSLYKSALLKDPIANVTGFLFRNFERYIRYSFVCEWDLLEFGGRSWRTWKEYLESSGQCSEI